MITNHAITLGATLGSNCRCEEDCFGECFHIDQDMVNDVIDNWIERNQPKTDSIRIESKAMNWDRRAGYLDTTLPYLISSMAINGEWELSFILEGNDLTIIRSSHDEPTGSSFTATFTEEEV